ncbi:class I SAM-dependent methyltransferase [Alcanivorax sp. JB21]|uniref:class I SAM-dependent methyltransferase n=1 Tax=Alcanivorax limicola TaxID=2874102 RepID=UPI001CBE3398|nr:class I SAM-dependent methyltransferase [Alcanivorax limicola]MBZ2189879.1 class I SAM-dependent methyltransferase [Alcanivorax limicola]
MSWYADTLFPPLLDWATRPLDRDRDALLASARGTVLELGVGTGANFSRYRDHASDIHGIEPGAAMLARARAHALSLPRPTRFHLVEAGAEALPYEDCSFDTVVACLVFCTIPDREAAAREIARVLKPDGQLLVLEHVESERKSTRLIQHGLNPVWRHLACGCQLTRDTGTLLQQSGFDTRGLQRRRHPKLPGFAGELLQGVATLAR